MLTIFKRANLSILVALVLLSAFRHTRVQAWGEVAHNVIGHIAYKLIKPKTQEIIYRVFYKPLIPGSKSIHPHPLLDKEIGKINGVFSDN